MPNQNIYVHTEDSYDQSRWLNITAPTVEECTLHLQDLCHPGQVSNLQKVSCPIGFLRTSLNHGPLQMTTQRGYAILRHRGEHVEIEFRGDEDASLTRVNVLLADVEHRIDRIAAESASRQAA